jgi:isoleucyl-tRNA synthetase
MVDKDGRKMSKSGDNALDVDELLKHFGADVCRWWTSSLAFESDIKVDVEFFELAGESYRKVRNTLRFLLSNVSDFDPTTLADELGRVTADSMDGYVLAEAAHLQRRVLSAYDEYEFRRAHLLLYDFCNETLSAFYCDAAKDRLYCDRADSPRRRRAQAVMWRLAELLCRLLAPILTHTADEAYRALWKDATDDEDDRCVHLTTIERFAFEADEGWSRALAAREDAQKALEAAKQEGIDNPLDAALLVPDPKGVLKRFAADLADVFGVSRVMLEEEAEQVSVRDLRSEPRCERCWKRDESTKPRSDGGSLCDRCAEAAGV